MEAVQARMGQFLDQYRAERNEWIHKAIECAETPHDRITVKHEICILLGVTPQWLNKLLRGDAYRRH